MLQQAMQAVRKGTTEPIFEVAGVGPHWVTLAQHRAAPEGGTHTSQFQVPRSEYDREFVVFPKGERPPKQPIVTQAVDGPVEVVEEIVTASWADEEVVEEQAPEVAKHVSGPWFEGPDGTRYKGRKAVEAAGLVVED